MALLRLRKRVPIKQHISPICLPDVDLIDTINRTLDMSNCVVTGWGQTSQGQSIGSRLLDSKINGDL
jgi:hypothetical protein